MDIQETNKQSSCLTNFSWRQLKWPVVLRWVLVVFYMSLIAYLTLSPSRRVAHFTLPIRNFDKLAHAFMHGGLAFLLCWAACYRFRHRLWLLYVVLFASAYGFLMELGQYHMPYGRTFSWGDVVANTVGAVIAVTLLGMHQVWRDHQKSDPDDFVSAGQSTDLPSGKRVFDTLAAAIGLVALSPLLLTIALLVRIYHGSPVLFKQTRPGLHGQPFSLLKFRTMTEEKDADGQLLEDEKRLTRLGRFLRATSLDEFPELINVLKGEMSLVGPRPLLMRYLERYSPEQAKRHLMPPGITGWAQVNGRNAITWKQKFEMDVWYVDNHSFWLDLKILWRTLHQVVARQDISAENHATMPEFMGNDEQNSE